MNAIRLLFIAKHEARKGLDDLMLALRRLRPGDWHLVVGGAGWAEDSDIVRLTSYLPPGSVSFLGRVDNAAVGPLMKTCDIVIVPSYYENLGNVAIEAQAAGIALIAAKVGGLRDVVQNEVTGLHFEPRDIEGLATCLARLCNDESLRMRLGHAAALRARRRYPWPHVARRTDRLFRLLIARARGQ